MKTRILFISFFVFQAVFSITGFADPREPREKRMDAKITEDYLDDPVLRKMEVNLSEIAYAADSKKEELIFNLFDNQMDQDEMWDSFNNHKLTPNELVQKYFGVSKIPEENKGCEVIGHPDRFTGISHWEYLKGGCHNGKAEGLGYFAGMTAPDAIGIHYIGHFETGHFKFGIVIFSSNNQMVVQIGEFENWKIEGAGYQSGPEGITIGKFKQNKMHGLMVFFNKRSDEKYCLKYIANTKQGQFDGFLLKVQSCSQWINNTTGRGVPLGVYLGFYNGQEQIHGPFGEAWYGKENGRLYEFYGYYRNGKKHGPYKQINRHPPHGIIYTNSYWIRTLRVGNYENSQRQGEVTAIHYPTEDNQRTVYSEVYKDNKRVSNTLVEASKASNFFKKAAVAGIGAGAYALSGAPAELSAPMGAAFVADVMADSKGNYTNTMGQRLQQAQSEASKLAIPKDYNSRRQAGGNLGSGQDQQLAKSNQPINTNSIKASKTCKASGHHPNVEMVIFYTAGQGLHCGDNSSPKVDFYGYWVAQMCPLGQLVLDVPNCTTGQQTDAMTLACKSLESDAARRKWGCRI